MPPQGFQFWETRPKKDKGDWLDEDGDWIDAYWRSREHPHRKLIIQSLREIGNVSSVLDAGCNCGPMLAVIKDELGIPEENMAGIDANKDAIDYGKERLPKADLRWGNFYKLPWGDKSFDAIVADACAMYIHSDDIRAVLADWDRVATRGIVIIDRYADSPTGELTSGGHIWARDYERLLADLGFEVTKMKLRPEDWPTSRGWMNDGWIWTASRP